MLEKILKLYTMAMAGDVRSPLPHLFGPPGCGKSSTVEQAAEIIGCQLHIINVSRISPLELEGVQMPNGELGDALALQLLHATWWTQLKEGDILLLDEFLRAFPEVYNGLLDILTSRQVGGFKLPKVFIIAASNSTVSYDKALEDRLLHLPVEDPRKGKRVKANLARLIVDGLGLHADMVDSMEMTTLLQQEVLPMYEMLDNLGRGGTAANAAVSKGRSVRNLIGQAQLRTVQSEPLLELIGMNNVKAQSKGALQYLFLLDGKGIKPSTVAQLKGLVGNPRLTEVQALNLNLNLQLIEMEAIRIQKGTDDHDESDDDPFVDDVPPF